MKSEIKHLSLPYDKSVILTPVSHDRNVALASPPSYRDYRERVRHGTQSETGVDVADHNKCSLPGPPPTPLLVVPGEGALFQLTRPGERSVFQLAR